MTLRSSTGDRGSRVDIHLGEHPDEDLRQRQGPSRRPEVRRERGQDDRGRRCRRQDRRREEHRAGPGGREHYEHPASQPQARSFLSGTEACVRIFSPAQKFFFSTANSSLRCHS